MIKEKHLPSLQGMFPSWITSCSKDGEPNTTVISQIWYVDENMLPYHFNFSIKQKEIYLKTLTHMQQFQTHQL